MSTDRAPDHRIGGPERIESADAVIAALAAGQHGVVSRTQLLAARVSSRQIERRVRGRRLHVVYRGVYAVGHGAVSPMGVWMAAVLAAGEGAALSHWSATTLWRMRQGRGPRSHVTSPRRRRKLGTITFHHTKLRADEMTEHQGIPTTTPARTLLDLAPLLPSPVLARMVEAAPWGNLAELLDRYPGRAGVAKLARIVATPQPMTRSDLEATMVEAIERSGLPRPEVNVSVLGYEVDFVWREHHDRERDRKLAIAGWRVVRITNEAAVGDLRRLLDATAARSPRHRASAA